MKIAFIGLGIMGGRMAQNLLRAGHELIVYNRTANDALNECVGLGAKKAASPAAAARDCEVIITMLSNPAAVEAVAFGPDGLLESAAKTGSGTGAPIWMDCSTVDPAFSHRMHGEARNKCLHFIDAPVAGSKEPAASGELVFLAGGDATALKRVEELLSVMGKKTIHAGGPGNGSALKMTVNLLLGTAIAAYSEAVALGTKLGLAGDLVQNVLLNTPVAAPVLGPLRARIDSGDFSPHFPLRHMHKDLQLAVSGGDAAGLSLGLTAAARDLFARALPARTDGDAPAAHEDFSAVFRVLNPA
jgi:3-hydroxyisobutyrate dehydrogenase-like beta-hydroxyacid dehydrogenase